MRPHSAVKGICLLCSLIVLAAGSRTAAALGEGPESVETDRKALAARLHSITQDLSYTVHEIQSGPVQIREYVSSVGLVFAVAWSGPVPPDLTKLLGFYASEYLKAERETVRRRGHRSRVVNTENITVTRWGHVGNLHGRAYVDTLIPPEVDIHDIQ